MARRARQGMWLSPDSRHGPARDPEARETNELALQPRTHKTRVGSTEPKPIPVRIRTTALYPYDLVGLTPR